MLTRPPVCTRIALFTVEWYILISNSILLFSNKINIFFHIYTHHPLFNYILYLLRLSRLDSLRVIKQLGGIHLGLDTVVMVS